MLLERFAKEAVYYTETVQEAQTLRLLTELQTDESAFRDSHEPCSPCSMEVSPIEKDEQFNTFYLKLPIQKFQIVRASYGAYSPTSFH